MTAFQPLSTGVQIYDKVNDPGFLTTRVGIGGIARFFVPGITAAEQAMALVFLEQHLFLPTINVSAVQGVTNVDEIEHFLDQLKPSWTNYIFGFESVFEESISFGETFNNSDISIILDLTTRVTQNELNLADPSQAFASTTGSVINVGGVNVLHDTVSFATFAWDDTVEIESGPNTGAYRIVSISGANVTLWPTPPALDTPVTYRIIYKEMALGHDAPEFTDQSYTIGTGAAVGRGRPHGPGPAVPPRWRGRRNDGAHHVGRRPGHRPDHPGALSGVHRDTNDLDAEPCPSRWYVRLRVLDGLRPGDRRGRGSPSHAGDLVR